MQYFGFIMSSIMYLTVICIMLVYIFSAIRGKYKFANNVLPLVFLHFLFSVMILSWALILMNGGFDIVFSLKLDYTILSFLIIPMLFIVLILDKSVRKKGFVAKNKLAALSRFILPGLTIILFSGLTLIYYFSCHYFVFLTAW